MDKSRNLSKADYFEAIQREYLIAQWRNRFYFRNKDKSYWERVMGFKKAKIDDIASKNRLNSIFNSPEKMEAMKNELFAEDGRPLFELNENDELNYYNEGGEFSYNGEIYTLRANGKMIVSLYQKSTNSCVDVYKSEIRKVL